MWKLSCLVFFLITTGNCSPYEHDGTTEISRNFRNYENQRHRSGAKSVEYEDRPYHEEYTRGDSDEIEGEKLIGKWRTSGAALEPKWRDGDSLPLVPFDAAKQDGKLIRPEIVKDSSRSSISNVPTRLKNRDEQSSRIPDEDTIEKIPVSLDYRPSLSNDKNGRYSPEENYERSYDPYDDSSTEENTFQRREKSKTSSTIEISSDLNVPSEVTEKNQQLTHSIEDDKILSRSRYRDTFQSHPNEYELNDDEYQKPRPRKRRPPQHYEFLETRAPTYSITWSTEKYTESTRNMDKITSKSTRKPEMTTRRRIEEKRNSTNRERPNLHSRRVSENAELKTLLKMQQTEGLSLSELLQRRNLTLDDLLKGKPEILNVLKSNSDENSAEVIGVKRKIFEPKKLQETTERAKWRPSQVTTEKIVNTTGNEISMIHGRENNVGKESSKKNGDFVDSMEELDSAEIENIQVGSNDNEKLSAIVRLTKPIILPHLNSLSEKSSTNDRVTKDSLEIYQNDDNSSRADKKSTLNLEEDEIMEFSDFTMKKKNFTGILPEETTTNGWEMKFDDSGSTLSIEHILSATEQTATILPNVEQKNFDTKVNSIGLGRSNSNESDIFGIPDFDYQSDEPREIIDENDEESTTSDEDYGKTTINVDEISTESRDSLLKNHQIFSTSNKPYEVVISEIEPEARAEIFELFSSGSSAKRLERLLKSRNMSIDELIELRQRGSSKVHLAEVLRTRENMRSRKFNSEAEIVVNSSRDEPTETILAAETTTDDLSNIEIESTSIETKEREQIRENETNISSIGTERTRIDSTTTMNDGNNQQLLDLLKSFDSLPFSVRPELPDFKKSLNRSKTKISTYESENIVEEGNVSIIPTSLIEVGLVEEIIEEDSNPVDNETTERNFGNNYSTATSRNNKEIKIFSKVRPSIIASGAILGVTIVVFFAIFIVCRIRQKQRYTYRNTFSRAVFQAPVMTARKLSNSSSLNTIMVNVVATSTTKRPERQDNHEFDDNFECKSDIENDSLDANDSWDTIPDFMK